MTATTQRRRTVQKERPGALDGMPPKSQFVLLRLEHNPDDMDAHEYLWWRGRQ